MAHGAAALLRTRLPFPTMLNHAKYESDDSSTLDSPDHGPSERIVAFVYQGQLGTTSIYLESMVRELARNHTIVPIHYGLLLNDHAHHPRERIRVDGEIVSSALFNKCIKECLDMLPGSNHPTSSRKSLREATSWERRDQILVDVALRIFDQCKVGILMVEISKLILPPLSSINSLPSAYDSKLEDSAIEEPLGLQHIERTVLESFRPDYIVCGLEPLPPYMKQIPSKLRAHISYLLRWQARFISSSQPQHIKHQLQTLSSAFRCSVEFAPSLSIFPACKDIEAGIFGPDQYRFAKLALALCQSMAYKSGFYRYIADDVQSPMLLSSRSKPTARVKPHPLSTPLWMVNGITKARWPGYFYSLTNSMFPHIYWNFNSAQTPDDFTRTGIWYNATTHGDQFSEKVLLVHLPESFVPSSRYICETSGKVKVADYRELLKSLYVPLRDVKWTHCIFAVDILREYNVIDSNVPPILAQYALRDYWSQISGVPFSQIYIAPSLSGALRYIATMYGPHKSASVNSFRTPPLDPKAARNGSHQTLSPPQSRLPIHGSAASSPRSQMSIRSRLSTIGFYSQLDGTAPTELLGARGNRKPSIHTSSSTNSSTSSLPARLRGDDIKKALSNNVEVLVTGSKSFVHSAILIIKS